MALILFVTYISYVAGTNAFVGLKQWYFKVQLKRVARAAHTLNESINRAPTAPSNIIRGMAKYEEGVNAEVLLRELTMVGLLKRAFIKLSSAFGCAIYIGYWVI